MMARAALLLLLSATVIDARPPTPFLDLRPPSYGRGGTLTVLDNSLVVRGQTADSGEVSVFDLTTGELTASAPTGRGSGLVAAGGNTIAVTSPPDATVYLFDRGGRLTASLQTDRVARDEFGFGAGVAVGGGRIAVGAPPAGILLFDAATGGFLRAIVLPYWEGGHVPLSLSDDTLFVGLPGYDSSEGHDVGRVYAFDAASGALRWRRHGPGRRSPFGQSLAGDGSYLVAGSWRERHGREYVALLDATMGDLRRTYRAPRLRSGFGTAVAIRGDRILVGAPETAHRAGRAYLFSRSTGARLETYALGEGRDAGRGVALAPGLVIVGAPESGHIVVFRAPVR